MAAAGSEPKLKRPFWMHQIAEYLLGGILVAQGLQSPTPAMPAIAGGLVVINVAIARGPLSAFGVVPREVHRMLDVVVMALVVLLGVQPWVSIESSTRVIMVVIAGVMAFIWSQSSFQEKVRRRNPVAADEGRSTEIGRLAGRAVGTGVVAARKVKRTRR